jgi:hypothetical protein
VKGWREDDTRPLSSFEQHQRDIRRRETENRLLAWAIVTIGAVLLALGLWALITLLIGAFG